MMSHEQFINENDVCIVLENFEDGWREVVGAFRYYKDAKEVMDEQKLLGRDCDICVLPLR